jgi:hypothetical protein
MFTTTSPAAHSRQTKLLIGNSLRKFSMPPQHQHRHPNGIAPLGQVLHNQTCHFALGIPSISKGTNTIVFIRQDNILIDQCKDVTYGRVCINYHPEKANPNCTRLIVGGNPITYLGDCGTPTVDMVTVKIHLNSVVFTKGARYCTIGLKDLYLNTPIAHPEFMRMKLVKLPKEFAQIYKLHNLATANGFVSIKIQNGMYGLPQAGILTQELLKKCLNKHGYCQSLHQK